MDQADKEQLEYLNAMLKELTAIAMQGDFGMLTYLINMANIEAQDILSGVRPARDAALSVGQMDETES